MTNLRSNSGTHESSAPVPNENSNVFTFVKDHCGEFVSTFSVHSR